MLQFAEPGLADEFAALQGENPGLALLVGRLAVFTRRNFGKGVIVTCIHRTLARQRTAYGRGTKKVDPRAALHGADLAGWLAGPTDRAQALADLEQRASPHLFWQAVDVRDWLYTAAEVGRILAFLGRYDAWNQLPVIPAARSRTAWLHLAGSHGPHFHIQYHGPPVVPAGHQE